MVDARTATARDFDGAAHRHANFFWIWLIITVIVVVVGHWWAVIPAAFALFQIAQSVSATRAAEALRMGTYRIPNPNNGAPDGNSAPL